KDVGLLADMMTVLASQSYYLGSTRHQDAGSDDQSARKRSRDRSNQLAPASPPWLFDILVESIPLNGPRSAGPVKIILGKQVNVHQGPLLELACRLETVVGTHAKNMDCRILLPSFGGNVEKVTGINFPDEYLVWVYRYSPHTRGPDVYLLVVVEAKS